MIATMATPVTDNKIINLIIISVLIHMMYSTTISPLVELLSINECSTEVTCDPELTNEKLKELIAPANSHRHCCLALETFHACPLLAL